MWVPKWKRDQDRGVDSPIPTQVVSNEEFLPIAQTEQQAAWEDKILELSEKKARKLGMERRDFMRSSMGMATGFMAANLVFGHHWEVDAAETEDEDRAAPPDIAAEMRLDIVREVTGDGVATVVEEETPETAETRGRAAPLN